MVCGHGQRGIHVRSWNTSTGRREVWRSGRGRTACIDGDVSWAHRSQLGASDAVAEQLIASSRCQNMASQRAMRTVHFQLALTRSGPMRSQDRTEYENTRFTRREFNIQFTDAASSVSFMSHKSPIVNQVGWRRGLGLASDSESLCDLLRRNVYSRKAELEAEPWDKLRSSPSFESRYYRCETIKCKLHADAWLGREK